MKLNRTRAWGAAAIAAALLAGCSHSDNGAQTDNAAKPTAQSTAPFNPQANAANIPIQAPHPGSAGTGQSGIPKGLKTAP